MRIITIAILELGDIDENTKGAITPGNKLKRSDLNCEIPKCDMVLSGSVYNTDTKENLLKLLDDSFDPYGRFGRLKNLEITD
jgi:hypothetical protein